MRHYLLTAFTILFLGTACAQQRTDHSLDGTWYVMSKTETDSEDDTVVDLDEELYDKGEKTYQFKGNTLTVTDGFGRRKTKLSLKINGENLYIGKNHKDKEPYIISLDGNQLILTKTETKKKKGKNQRKTEIVVLEK